MTSAAASLKERVVSNPLEADFWVTMWNKLTEPDFWVAVWGRLIEPTFWVTAWKAFSAPEVVIPLIPPLLMALITFTDTDLAV